MVVVGYHNEWELAQWVAKGEDIETNERVRGIGVRLKNVTEEKERERV